MSEQQPDTGAGQVPQTEGPSGGRKISRRAFIGLGVAAAAALAVGGRELFQALSHQGTAGTTGGTQGGGFNIKDFKIQRVTSDPTYQPDQWRLSVTGLVQQELSLSLDEFLALPQTQEVREFECVEGWTVQSCPWEGVTVHEIMSQAGIKPEAKYIVFWSDDGVYSDALSVEQALKPEVILAHKLGGQELAPAQGWPVRLVMPGNYGYKYVKWVGRVVVTDQPHVGYWEENGYPDNATIPQP